MKIGWTALLIASLLGLLTGVAIAVVLFGPPRPVEIHFAGKPVGSFVREGHHIHTYEMAGSIDDAITKAKKELSTKDGWQPMTMLSEDPKVAQFTRVKNSKDFQFVRVVLESRGAGKVSVMLDEGPKQTNAFQ